MKPNLKINKLTAKKQLSTHTNPNYNLWQCVCDCGNKLIVSESELINQEVKSCGCANIKHSKKIEAATGKFEKHIAK